MLKEAIKSFPYVSRLHREIAQLKSELKRWRTWMPPGHFYSPIPALDEVKRDDKRIFQAPSPTLLGIELNANQQLDLLCNLAAYHSELPSAWSRKGEARYFYENEYYSWADAIVLYGMLRHFQPKRVVEVGSGYSSAVILDTCDAFLKSAVSCTFIDPYPERLKGLLAKSDPTHAQVLEKRVQDVDMAIFATLAPGDFLIIDSSHVSKTGSDLNHILFEIIPRLKPGVHLHFHDIFFPFEYPRAWVEAGVAWNEAYVLRAFLQYNTTFQIEFFTSYLIQTHRAAIEASLPWMLRSERDPLKITDAPGCSIWIRHA